METGTVIFYDPDRGFGFVETENPEQGQVFLHVSELQSETPTPKEGDTVAFTIEPNFRRKHPFKATQVRVVLGVRR